MKYDTAGNRIYEPIQNCGCELTGGCEKCQIGKWKVKFDNDLEERNKRLFSQPLGVSRWKEIGKKYGYWKYFESQVKKEIIKEFIEGKRCFSCGDFKKTDRPDLTDTCYRCTETM